VPQAPHESYERLEFLGDSVVGLVVCERLYRSCPDSPEGELARRRAYLVSRGVLAEAARTVGLDSAGGIAAALEHLGDRARESVLADAFEALVGAIFLDRGYRTARRVVNGALAPAFGAVRREGFAEDPKTCLQELTQARWRVLPDYQVGPPAGADHAPLFEAVVRLQGHVAGRGTGGTKKEAEQRAAREALARLRGEGEPNGRD
jgi:ribonuclease-3